MFDSIVDVCVVAAGDALVDPGRMVQFSQLQLSSQDTKTNKIVKIIPSDLDFSPEGQDYVHRSNKNYHIPEVMLLRRQGDLPNHRMCCDRRIFVIIAKKPVFYDLSLTKYSKETLTIII